MIDDESLASGGELSAGESNRSDRVAIPSSTIRPITSVHSARNYGIRLVDFVMCWMALCGLVKVAVVAAALNHDGRLLVNGHPIETSLQKCMWLGQLVVVPVCGFLYMAWREGWQFRLSAIFKIALFCCVILGIAQAAPAVTMVVVPVFAIFVLVYAIRWSSRQKLA